MKILAEIGPLKNRSEGRRGEPMRKVSEGNYGGFAGDLSPEFRNFGPGLLVIDQVSAIIMLTSNVVVH